MKKIMVPKDKYPLDVLAELGEQTRNSWIFIERKLVLNLLSECSETNINCYVDGIHCIRALFNATQESPATMIWLCNTAKAAWMMVAQIDAENIAFSTPFDDPDEILMLKGE